MTATGEETPSWRDSHEYNGSMPRLVFFCFRHGSSREGASPHSHQCGTSENTYSQSLDIFVKCLLFSKPAFHHHTLSTYLVGIRVRSNMIPPPPLTLPLSWQASTQSSHLEDAHSIQSWKRPLFSWASGAEVRFVKSSSVTLAYAELSFLSSNSSLAFLAFSSAASFRSFC